jgi:hypothetical protein
MNELVRFEGRVPATAADMRAHVNLVQEVMKAVMQEGTHYGKIPGTPKPSLWKPGAEVLGATFHIAPSYKVEDLSTEDCARYRVTCTGTHQATGIVMGEGMGACSSNEEKYKWRKVNSNAEFDAAPENRRRVKYGKDYETKQVRTECADIDNTVLKMACKRAQVAMALNVTAASDIFTQDIEDLPEELREREEKTAPKLPDGQRLDFENAIEALTDRAAGAALWPTIAKACFDAKDKAANDALKEKLVAKVATFPQETAHAAGQ